MRTSLFFFFVFSLLCGPVVFAGHEGGNTTDGEQSMLNSAHSRLKNKLALIDESYFDSLIAYVETKHPEYLRDLKDTLNWLKENASEKRISRLEQMKVDIVNSTNEKPLVQYLSNIKDVKCPRSDGSFPEALDATEHPEACADQKNRRIKIYVEGLFSGKVNPELEAEKILFHELGHLVDFVANDETLDKYAYVIAALDTSVFKNSRLEKTEINGLEYPTIDGHLLRAYRKVEFLNYTHASGEIDQTTGFAYHKTSNADLYCKKFHLKQAAETKIEWSGTTSTRASYEHFGYHPQARLHFPEEVQAFEKDFESSLHELNTQINTSKVSSETLEVYDLVDTDSNVQVRNQSISETPYTYKVGDFISYINANVALDLTFFYTSITCK